jgi:aspartate/methionine/tyrosine aminotransferase
VEHPFAGQPSKKVCERLAKELGVVVLPSAFFQEDDPKVVERDRLMRVSIANVGDAEVIDMCGRLKDCDDWTWD